MHRRWREGSREWWGNMCKERFSECAKTWMLAALYIDGVYSSQPVPHVLQNHKGL